MRCGPGERGFALAETLVALAIIAGMTSLAYETLSGTAQIGSRMAERRDAVLVAQSVLAEATAAGVGNSGRAGQQGPLDWRIDIEPFSQGTRQSGPPLERIDVTVFGHGSGRKLASLTTLRLTR